MNVTEHQQCEKPFAQRPGQFSRIREMVTEGTRRDAVAQSSPSCRVRPQPTLVRPESLQEGERLRIARDLHDELGPLLTAIDLDLSFVEQRLAEFKGDPRVKPILERLIEARELADITIQSVQEIATELRPSMVKPMELVKGLQQKISRFEKRTGISCVVHLPKQEPSLPSASLIVIFRILREALTNIARHAAATQVEVELQVEAEGCRLMVRDNGRGFGELDLAKPESLGLLGMQERAGSLGGRVAFSSHPGKGTLVNAWIPHPFAPGASV